MTKEDDKGVASAALSIIERLRKDMDVSKVRNATVISRSQLDTLEAALEALRERACTPPPENHKRGIKDLSPDQYMKVDTMAVAKRDAIKGACL